MGNFAAQRQERQENLPRYWKSESNGDRITGKVLGAGMTDNYDKNGQIPTVAVADSEGFTTTIDGNRKALANLLIDLDPEPGDYITIVQTGTKPSTRNPNWKPTVLYAGKNFGKEKPTDEQVNAVGFSLPTTDQAPF